MLWFILLCSASMLHAETRPTTPAVAGTLNIYATADRPERPDISAINKTTITQTDMLRYGDASVSDALRRAAGIQLNGAGGGAKKAKFRGAGAAPTILVNGEPLQGGRRGDTSLVDTFSVDMINRIEVTRQASVTQGSVAAGGVINIILKDPRDGSLGGVIKGGYGQAQQHGQSNEKRQFNVQLDGRQNQWGYSVSATDSQLSTQNHTQIERANGINSTQVRQNTGAFRMIAPRLQYEFADHDKAFVDLFYSEHSIDNRSNSDHQTIDSNQTKLNTRFEQKNGQRKDTWRLSGEWVNEQERNTQHSILSGSDDSTDHFSASYSGSQPITAAHQLKFGAKSERSRLSSDIEADLTEQRHALYVEDNWSITPRSTLTSGLRQEWLLRRGLVQADDHSLSPAVAWRFLISPTWSIQASGSVARNTPKTDDLSPTLTLSTSTDAGSLNNPDHGGNPALRAERVSATEIGTSYNTDQGGINLTVFRRQIDDYIERITRLENNRYVQRPQNQPHAIATGIELDGRMNISQHGGHSLLLNGQLSTIRAEIQSNGQDDRLASDVAPYTTSIGVSYQYQPWHWSINSNVGYTPYYERIVDGQSTRKAQNARTTLDISSTKRFDAGWAMTLAANNLLSSDRIDTLYTNSGQFSQRRTVASSPTVLLTIEHRF
jgi:outer membrane receptor for ferrienterochelin and colicin